MTMFRTLGSLLLAVLIFVLALLAGACSGPSDGDDTPPDADGLDDGQVELDAGLDAAPDADVEPDAGGLQLGQECDVLAEECAAGLTCRLADAQGSGACRPVGELLEGGDCEVSPFAPVSPCGAAMACVDAPGGFCGVLCDVDDPEARCASGQRCAPYVADVIGICW